MSCPGRRDSGDGCERGTRCDGPPTFRILAPLLTVLRLVACGGDEACADVERAAFDPDAAEGGGFAVAEFAAELYGALRAMPGKLVLSPYSVAVALDTARAARRARPPTRSAPYFIPPARPTSTRS